MKKIIPVLIIIFLFIISAVMLMHTDTRVSVTVPDDSDAHDSCFDTVIPDGITYQYGKKYTTPYGSFLPIEHVLEVNAYMAAHHYVHSYENSRMYITETGDDEIAEKIMAEIKSLSDEICRELESDREKAEALAMWTGLNLVYDGDAAQGLADHDVTTLEAILSGGYRTTCGGFGNFYAALCHSQGIYCINMKGGSSSGGWLRKDLEKAPANHEWNGVVIDGQWYFVDCTWISDRKYVDGNCMGGEDIKPFYAFFGFEEMSIEHRIDRCEHRCYGC